MSTQDKGLRQIAVGIILDHAFDIEFISIQEMYEFLTDDEAREVYDLIFDKANVSVTWDD